MDVGNAVGHGVLLGPLASQDGSLEELLAGVLLEESLVDDGASKIVNHKLDDGVNVLFGVASIVSQGRVLLMC